ncbi:AraC family transcriptional regulator [Flavivirga aquimarina]|uniref:AraC family transcriptional regulator n=1 Tax=Flavivirga aquimarina TaxID=2027862 RepID=A0ABT8WFB1_9FLAO|nr:AraC family transcriptional regulator [Flavivirga aquimarina]MDO5971825.1 AraC family transcriptional regulator [Flavivirga aquimarina]
MNNNTKKTYIKRINIAIDYIENNLDKELSLELLSKKACYSPFHFHRLFSFITGETVNSFLNRKRIERVAAILLVGTTKSISELAFKYGFSSGNSFSRAFKKFYGISPMEFKHKGEISKIGVDITSVEKYICQIDNTLNWIKMNGQIEIKELPEMKLIGMTHIGEFDKVGSTYEKLLKWMTSKNLINSKNLKAVTVYHDNPKVTNEDKVRLSTCFTTNEDVKVEGDVKQVRIQKGFYVVGSFEIAPESFSKAWNSICVWIAENGYEFEDGHYFELYHNDNRTHPEHKFIVDICIPIKKPNNYLKNTKQVNNGNLTHYRKQIKKGDIQKDYKKLLTYIKRLRTHFIKTYPIDYKIGSVYQGNMDFSFFPFTPIALKNQKLKIVIIFNHAKMQFEICLAGRNRQIQKKYWDIFRDSDWNKYHIPDTMEGFSIVDHIIMKNPDFNNFDALSQHIETETMKFIRDIVDVLDV